MLISDGLVSSDLGCEDVQRLEWLRIMMGHEGASHASLGQNRVRVAGSLQWLISVGLRALEWAATASRAYFPILNSKEPRASRVCCGTPESCVEEPWRIRVLPPNTGSAQGRDGEQKEMILEAGGL